MPYVEYIGTNSGFSVIDNLATGWYVHVDGYPVAGPWESEAEAESKLVMVSN